MAEKKGVNASAVAHGYSILLPVRPEPVHHHGHVLQPPPPSCESKNALALSLISSWTPPSFNGQYAPMGCPRKSWGGGIYRNLQNCNLQMISHTQNAQHRLRRPRVSGNSDQGRSFNISFVISVTYINIHLQNL